jgi:hypothetical protein
MHFSKRVKESQRERVRERVRESQTESNRVKENSFFRDRNRDTETRLIPKHKTA